AGLHRYIAILLNRWDPSIDGLYEGRFINSFKRDCPVPIDDRLLIGTFDVRFSLNGYGSHIENIAAIFANADFVNSILKDPAFHLFMVVRKVADGKTQFHRPCFPFWDKHLFKSL